MTARLPGASYSASQMTYDLRRLRLNGLICRIEHTHTLMPLAATGQPQAPPALRQALTVIDRHVDDYITRARLKHAT